MAQPATRVRLIALGDELLAGIGDPRALGWLGRVVARQAEKVQVDTFPCALPGDNTTSLAERWQLDVALRSDLNADAPIAHKVVVGLGSHDITSGISIARSRLNLAKVLDGLENEQISSFVVGPPPSRDRGRTNAISELSNAYADVCSRRNITYVDTVHALEHHDQWLSEVTASADDIPGQIGYGLMAWLVLHSGFEEWISTN